MIAALYIDERGPYPKLLGVDAWGVSRDAMRYEGPHPVVAHPDCGPWANLRHLARNVSTIECGLRAVGQVRRFGGVLEHPARSRLWETCKLPLPGAEPDEHGGYTLEVQQCEWGHVARKRTWLYLVRVPREALEAPPFPGATPTHWASGGRRHERKGSGGFAPPGIKICSAQKRRRTPVLFAEYLVRLARAAGEGRPENG